MLKKSLSRSSLCANTTRVVFVGCMLLFSAAALADQTLTIIIDGIGTTSPAGAPTTGVTYSYTADSTITVEALWGKRGWAFSHWTGDIDAIYPEQNRIELPMNMNRTITAHYVLSDFTLTIGKTGNGNTSPAPAAYGFLNGRTAAFKSVLVPGGDAFSTWSGDLADDAEAASEAQELIMDRNRTMTAAFVPGDYMLTVNGISGGGSGTLSPSAGAYSYLTGQTASVDAEPGGGMYWGGWSGDLNTFELSAEITMDGNKTVTPTITVSGYQLTVSTNEYWWGLTSPSGTIDISANAIVPIHALPWYAGYFQEWTGAIPEGVDSQSPDIEVTMDRNREITAVFAEKDWYLYIQYQGNGTTNPAPGMHWYFDGDVVTLTAFPGENSLFLGWDGLRPEEGDPAESAVNVTIDVSRIITAVFVPALIEVPSLIGLSRNAAENTLLAMGLTLGEVVQDYSDSVPADTVCVQNPVAGESVPYKGQVDITLSLGPPLEEGEGFTPVFHSADIDQNNRVSLNELLRVVQLFNSRGYHCAGSEMTEDGYKPEYGANHECALHSSDYSPVDWLINLSELLRLIQIFYSNGYYYCPEQNTEDGFCLGSETL